MLFLAAILILLSQLLCGGRGEKNYIYVPEEPETILLPLELKGFKTKVCNPPEFCCSLNLTDGRREFTPDRIERIYSEVRQSAKNFHRFTIEEVTKSDKKSVRNIVLDLQEKAAKIDDNLLLLVRHFIAYTLNGYHHVLNDFHWYTWSTVESDDFKARICNLTNGDMNCDTSILASNIILINRNMEYHAKHFGEIDFEFLRDLAIIGLSMMENNQLQIRISRPTSRIYDIFSQTQKARDHVLKILQAISDYTILVHDEKLNKNQ